MPVTVSHFSFAGFPFDCSIFACHLFQIYHLLLAEDSASAVTVFRMRANYSNYDGNDFESNSPLYPYVVEKLLPVSPRSIATKRANLRRKRSNLVGRMRGKKKEGIKKR